MQCSEIFFQFLPIPTTIKILLPTHSPPASRTLPAPILLGSLPPNVLLHSSPDSLFFLSKQIQLYLGQV